MILLPQKVAYRGTVTGLRISSVDGTAFLDALPSAVTDLAAADPGNYLLEIYDATGKVLKGYLKAAGDGEDLGDELVTLGDFSADTGWTLQNGFSIGAGVLTGINGPGAYALRTPAATMSVGQLFKGTISVTAISGNHDIIISGTPQTLGGYFGTTGSKTLYATKTETKQTVGIRRSVPASSTCTMDDLSIKRVTTPSTDGCTIVSTKGGATQSFATVQVGFAYNAAAYSVVVRKAR